MTAKQALLDLHALTDAKQAQISSRYFKAGPGEYGEGDIFLGIKVPVTRAVAKKHRSLPLVESLKLLRDKHHEARLLALLILVDQFRKGDEPTRSAIYSAYLANRKWINNWDLVDTSARDIVGAYLAGRSHRPLFDLAKSEFWNERRIAIIATQHFIRLGRFETTIALSKKLMADEHDLMHKAVGWMLREMGDRDVETLHGFLREHAHEMPRTMLRYAVEKLPEATRRKYMAMKAQRA